MVLEKAMNDIYTALSGYRPLLKVNESDECSHAVLALNAKEVKRAAAQGFTADDILYLFPTSDALGEILDKCRIFTDDYDIIEYINDLSVKRFDSMMSRIALAVVPKGYEGYRGIPFDKVGEFSVKAKKLRCISLRGAYMNGYIADKAADDISKYFHHCYQCAKMMTVLIPCSMPYLVFGNCVEQLNRIRSISEEEFNKCIISAKTVAMQNETAFYSRLFID